MGRVPGDGAGEKTLVLIGRTGNGKSALGNSILGRRAFKSVARASGVTQSCQMQQALLKNGETINVIDTPGLFDISAGSAFISKEIVRCFSFAKDGIHAFLLVLSVRNRFSEEEEGAIQSIQELFGSKIIDYMIVVFTGGDELENNDLTFEDYLGEDCPKPLQEILRLTKNRTVLFNNVTKDERKKAEQLQKLLSLVNTVVGANGGKPYTNELWSEVKREASNKKSAEYDAKLKKITEELEAKLEAATSRLEKQLAEEQAALRRIQEEALSTQKRSLNEIAMLRESLDRANRQIHAPPRRRGGGGCSIM